MLLTLGVAFVLDDLALVIWGGDTFTVAGARMRCAAPLRIGAHVLSEVPAVRAAVRRRWSSSRCGCCCNHTRLGALIRAGVDDAEMVEAMGINIRRVFLVHLHAGRGARRDSAALLGGAFLTLYPTADSEILVFSLAVVIIGGRGSLVGAAVGSLLVGMLEHFRPGHGFPSSPIS